MGRPLPHGTQDAELATVQGVQVALLSRVEGECVTYVWKNLLISVWAGEATLTGLAIYEQHVRPTFERYPQGVSTINIIVPGKYSFPNADARREFQRFVQQYAAQTATTLIVLPGTGFMSSALRGVITALALASPRGGPKMHVVESTRDAAEWLPAMHSERTGVAISADELLTLLEIIKSTIT
ncbi:MAG TPA: hypothetical protein VFN67_19565 [Polyangiales bacterium]|jgi:hypothetical protein|nr:hypothetical protein [Polyangiales bacterium]